MSFDKTFLNPKAANFIPEKYLCKGEGCASEVKFRISACAERTLVPLPFCSKCSKIYQEENKRDVLRFVCLPKIKQLKEELEKYKNVMEEEDVLKFFCYKCEARPYYHCDEHDPDGHFCNYNVDWCPLGHKEPKNLYSVYVNRIMEIHDAIHYYKLCPI